MQCRNPPSHRNPHAASEVLLSGLSSNGQDLDSSDLLLVLDLQVFREEAELQAENEAGVAGRRPGGGSREQLNEMAAHEKMARKKKQFCFSANIFERKVVSTASRCGKFPISPISNAKKRVYQYR